DLWALLPGTDGPQAAATPVGRQPFPVRTETDFRTVFHGQGLHQLATLSFPDFHLGAVVSAASDPFARGADGNGRQTSVRPQLYRFPRTVAVQDDAAGGLGGSGQHASIPAVCDLGESARQGESLGRPKPQKPRRRRLTLDR